MHITDTSIFATGGVGLLIWAANQTVTEGASWAQFAPTLIGIAAVIQAVCRYLNDRQARRHADERFVAEMAAKCHVATTAPIRTEVKA